MERDDFLEMLVAGVAQKWITLPQAVELLKGFDAGEIKESDLPLPHRQAVVQLTDADLERALRAIEDELERNG